MKILKSIITLSFVLLLSNVEAQIGVGSKNGSRSAVKIKKKYLEILKNSETIFFCRANDDIELFQERLTESWSYTKKITCVSEERIEEYELKNENYSYFKIFRHAKVKQHGTDSRGYGTGGAGPRRTTTTYNYSLRLYIKKKNFKKYFCSINLTPSLKCDIKDITEGNLERITFSNWGEGYASLFLKNVNKHLKNDKLQDKYIKAKSTGEVKKLKRYTLYVQESSLKNILYKLKDPKKIFESYEFDYKIISDEDLNKKLMNDSNFYFMTSDYGITTIYNSETSDIVYSKTSLIPSLTVKKIKKLSKSISKY